MVDLVAMATTRVVMPAQMKTMIMVGNAQAIRSVMVARTSIEMTSRALEGYMMSAMPIQRVLIITIHV